MEQNLEKFLITYVETEEFNKMIEEEVPLQPSSLQYAKIMAPNLNEVANVLGRRFSDVQIIGIAAESDFTASLEKLQKVDKTSNVYVISRQDSNGNVITDLITEEAEVDGHEIVAQLTAEEFLTTLQIPLSFLRDEKTPTIHFQE